MERKKGASTGRGGLWGIQWKEGAGRHVDRGPYLYDIPTPYSCRIYDRSTCQIGELVVHLGAATSEFALYKALARLYNRLTCTCIATM